jgi:predicted metal-binding membrane protein
VTPTSRFVAMTSTRATTFIATLGVAAVAWVIAVQQMDGMDMGVATDLGSFAFFIAVWIAMMAAMMLPAAVPAVSSFARATGRALAAPVFAGSYLAVWTLFGIVVYALYQPHGAAVAGALTIAAGIYELTPLKRACRRRCLSSVGSGFEFGAYCVGSSIGLMVMLVALGAMSVTWMVAIAALVLAQKLLPPKAFLDVPVAVAIVTLGLLVAITPTSVPGLVV